MRSRWRSVLTAQLLALSPRCSQLPPIAEERKCEACDHALCGAHSKSYFWWQSFVPVAVRFTVIDDGLLDHGIVLLHWLACRPVGHGVLLVNAPMLEDALPEFADKRLAVVAGDGTGCAVAAEDFNHFVSDSFEGWCS